MGEGGWCHGLPESGAGGHRTVVTQHLGVGGVHQPDVAFDFARFHVDDILNG